MEAERLTESLIRSGSAESKFDVTVCSSPYIEYIDDMLLSTDGLCPPSTTATDCLVVGAAVVVTAD